MTSVLPPPTDYAALVPGPSSPVWQYASDARLGAVSGYALLLQVAHPTVGAGVAQHSNFQADPWGRLYRTLDYVNGSIYGGPELAGEIGRRVREMHRDIKGVGFEGQRYHAMEPDAYAWVHATLASAIVHGHRTLGRGMSDAVAAEFWRDWLKVGRLIGVRERDLPEEWADFEAYFEAAVAGLSDNVAVHMVLDTLDAPARPFDVLPMPVWRALRWPAAKLMRLTTLGMLPPALRDRLDVEWTRRDARAFARIAAVNRALTPLLRGPLRAFGPTYVKLRRVPLERGDVARRTHNP